MGYSYSSTDNSNIQWFSNDHSKNTLTDISINGSIRGLTNTSMHMDYPISAIAGKNGCGKSTLLALAACAFHNDSEYTPFKQKKKYYTFGDFFTFVADEQGISGVTISYTINVAQGKNKDIRRKKPSGKWNDFNTRFKRKVAFMGINRIVPPSESTVHKNYKRLFEDDALAEDLERKITGHMTHIFGHKYEHMSLLSHNAYHLFRVQRNDIAYTGFNMGAGENAVLQLLIELYTIGQGGMIVIDEIELGLHVAAQKVLIKELKEICKEKHCQIICSTHSQYIINSLPPEGRFLIEKGQACTNITSRISPEYALGRMADTRTEELDIFTEDEVGKSIVEVFLPCNLRERVKITPIGSDQAVVRQLAAHYREGKLNCLAFMDGDKHTAIEQHKRNTKKALEDRVNEDFDDWITSALNYLPGECWPERYIIEKATNEIVCRELAEKWDATAEEITEFFEKALAAGKHNEFYSISESVHLDLEAVRNDIISLVKKTSPKAVSHVREKVKELLHVS